MPQYVDCILNLPDYEVLNVQGNNPVTITARHVGPVHCPECGSATHHNKPRLTHCRS